MLGKALLSASVSAPPAAYVEDVFSTWLYTGNSSTQTITNGIDLAGEGGLVWCKSRSAAYVGELADTVRGGGKRLVPSSSNSQDNVSDITGFTSSGFTLGNQTGDVNFTGVTAASWTFRKAEKFFDVVTYTGTGADQTISHNLGSTPGCIIVKQTSGAGGDWYVYHRSLSTPSENWIRLNNTGAANGAIGQDLWGPPTSTTFKVDTYLGLSTSSATYVAYVFAHDAGGFGDAGTDSVVKCGSFTHNASSDQEIDLGWEAQWVMLKSTDSTIGWYMVDTMRGAPVGGNASFVTANSSSAESTGQLVYPTAKGFAVRSGAFLGGSTHIYIAIRRGPMKTPTDATEVFGLNARSGTGANATVTGGQVDDAVLIKNRGSAVASLFSARLTGTGYLVTSSTAAEVAAGTTILQANPWDVMDGVKVGTTSTITNASGSTFINYLFRRAPGFFDVVAYTGTGVARTVPHNLGVEPELMIVKRRNTVGNWCVYSAPLGATKAVYLNYNFSEQTDSTFWNNTAPTDAVFTLGTNSNLNQASSTHIAYLFATCPGVSKVGSYTGTGTTLNIDCGFAAGARFVMIKRTDSTGDWYVWDTARGIIAGNDPYLLLNSTAAEVTNTDYIDPLSSGFQISSTAPAAINASGGSFIFLAIA